MRNCNWVQKEGNCDGMLWMQCLYCGAVDKEPCRDSKKTAELSVDDWLDAPTVADENERYAKWVIFHFRLPAVEQQLFSPIMKDHKLFCTYTGVVHRVTGASRLGDVWLALDYQRETGYDLRVHISQCINWSKEP
jgi:hypothetical protein